MVESFGIRWIGRLRCGGGAESMGPQTDIESAFREFSFVASQFCALVDSAPSLDRVEFLSRIYDVLPQLIHQRYCAAGCFSERR